MLVQFDNRKVCPCLSDVTVGLRLHGMPRTTTPRTTVRSVQIDPTTNTITIVGKPLDEHEISVAASMMDSRDALLVTTILYRPDNQTLGFLPKGNVDAFLDSMRATCKAHGFTLLVTIYERREDGRVWCLEGIITGEQTILTAPGSVATN